MKLVRLTMTELCHKLTGLLVMLLKETSMVANMKIHHSQLTCHLCIGKDNNLKTQAKLELTKTTIVAVVLYGRDQMNFQELQNQVFGVPMVLVSKPLNKAPMEIAGSYQQLQLLLELIQKELKKSSLTLNTQLTVLSK